MAKGWPRPLNSSLRTADFLLLIAPEGRFPLAKRPSAAMSEEKRLPFAG